MMILNEYIKAVKKSFKYIGKNEKEYLKKIEYQIRIQTSVNITYEELVEKFGNPNDIALAYYEEWDGKCIQEKARNRKKYSKILWIIVCLSIIITALIYSNYNDGKDSYITRENTTITEE